MALLEPAIVTVPYAEVILTFGSRPLLEPTKEQLAVSLREAILESFVPYR